MAQDFLLEEGPKLQRYLKEMELIFFKENNYVEYCSFIFHSNNNYDLCLFLDWPGSTRSSSTITSRVSGRSLCTCNRGEPFRLLLISLEIRQHYRHAQKIFFSIVQLLAESRRWLPLPSHISITLAAQMPHRRPGPLGRPTSRHSRSWLLINRLSYRWVVAFCMVSVSLS